MSLKLQCPECGKTFSSIMLYDDHLHKNSRQSFLELFEKILTNEMAIRNQPGLQVVIDNLVGPELAELRKNERKKSKVEQRASPNLTKHKKVGKKK